MQQENAAATSGQNFEHSKKNTDYLAPQSGNAFRGETRGPSNNRSIGDFMSSKKQTRINLNTFTSSFVRWNNDSGQYDNRGYGYGGSYGGGRGGYGRGGESNRGGSFYGSGPRKNELGFHGDMRPNPRVEQELFHTNESQIAGINFDRVCFVIDLTFSFIIGLCCLFFHPSTTTFLSKSAKDALSHIMIFLLRPLVFNCSKTWC